MHSQTDMAIRIVWQSNNLFHCGDRGLSKPRAVQNLTVVGIHTAPVNSAILGFLESRALFVLQRNKISSKLASEFKKGICYRCRFMAWPLGFMKEQFTADTTEDRKQFNHQYANKCVNIQFWPVDFTCRSECV